MGSGYFEFLTVENVLGAIFAGFETRQQDALYELCREAILKEMNSRGITPDEDASPNALQKSIRRDFAAGSSGNGVKTTGPAAPVAALAQKSPGLK